MQNVKYAIKGKRLLLEIDLTQDTGVETKGGNRMVATSDNWSRFPEMPGFAFNMVLTRKPGSAMPADTPDETMVERPASSAMRSA